MADFSFRWGIPELDAGYTPVYNFMLHHYAEAGITRDEFLCILHLASYHYESAEGKSKPSQDRIAKEMGYKHRNSIMRLIQSLENKGMLNVKDNPGYTSEYNFAPFSRRCLALFLVAQANVQEGAHGNVQVGAQQRVHEEESIKNKNSKNKTKEGANAPRVDTSTGEVLPSKNDKPAAVVVFKEVMHFWPHKSLHDLIVNAVGEDGLQLQRWRDVLVQWLSKGYSPRNVEGVLDVWAHGWKKHGAKPKAAKPSKRDYLGGKFGNEIQH